MRLYRALYKQNNNEDVCANQPGSHQDVYDGIELLMII